MPGSDELCIPIIHLVLQEGETLSGIARRCSITETKILDLNPNVVGSKDLRAGMTLALDLPAGQDATARAGEATFDVVETTGSTTKSR